MRESFVIHAEYIEDLPDEYKLTYLQYIYNYGIFDTEPELEGFELSIWIKIKRRIDQDRQAYEERKEKNRRRQEEWRKKREAEDPATEVVPSDAELEKEVPVICTPSQTEYSKLIFNIFNNAGLPCCKGNEISFLMTDFGNGLRFIHDSNELKHIHSDDIIAACKNYVEVLEDADCYVTTRMSFYKLVQSKIFYNLLPANYDKSNFKSFKNNNNKKTTASTSTGSEKKWYEETPCPSCKEKKVVWSNSHNYYRCECCGHTYKIGEI